MRGGVRVDFRTACFLNKFRPPVYYLDQYIHSGEPPRSVPSPLPEINTLKPSRNILSLSRTPWHPQVTNEMANGVAVNLPRQPMTSLVLGRFSEREETWHHPTGQLWGKKGWGQGGHAGAALPHPRVLVRTRLGTGRLRESGFFFKAISLKFKNSLANNIGFVFSFMHVADEKFNKDVCQLNTYISTHKLCTFGARLPKEINSNTN